ncbi:Conidiation protein 6-domain-containing protein [Mycena leptocephala]|nr:Conidiation protein 6-domain-containing protein [Mycena leptocephala]
MGAATTDDAGESKATLTNEATSSDEYLEDTDTAGDEHNDEHQTRVLAGYKAALHNPRVSEEAKQHASEYLEEHNA